MPAGALRPRAGLPGRSPDGRSRTRPRPSSCPAQFVGLPDPGAGRRADSRQHQAFRVGVDVAAVAAEEADQRDADLARPAPPPATTARTPPPAPARPPSPPSGSARSWPAPLTISTCPASGSRPSRTASPTTLSTALCRPTSSRSATSSPAGGEQPGGVQPAGLVEHLLRGAQPVRQREQRLQRQPGVVGGDVVGASWCGWRRCWPCRRPRRSWTCRSSGPGRCPAPRRRAPGRRRRRCRCCGPRRRPSCSSAGPAMSAGRRRSRPRWRGSRAPGRSRRPGCAW